MARKKRGSPFLSLFGGIGSGLFKVGEKLGGKPGEEEAAERLEKIKEATVAPVGPEFVPEEEREWMKRRAELRRPFSERLTNFLISPFKRPAQRMLGSFKGLERDLYRANMKISPEAFVALTLALTLLAGIPIFLLASLLLPFPLNLPIGMFGFIFIFMYARNYPRKRALGRFIDINRKLPYVLRHLSTSLNSGVGLPEAIVSVSQADYGALSEEFGRVVHDVKAGMSLEDALARLDERVESLALRRCVRQIRRTLQTGGDLAKILTSMANETSFELRMKLRDYTQSLNLFALMYMFASSVLPAMLIIAFTVMGRIGAAALPPQLISMMLIFLLPMLLLFLVLTIKRMEPKL
jgi:flagellar protein FlaJ